MIQALLAVSIPKVDIAFFVICGVIIAGIVGFYFLIPVINKKQYQEMRDNLKKREAAFQNNIQDYAGAKPAAQPVAEEPAAAPELPAEESPAPEEK